MAYLTLSDGTVFEGSSFGSTKEAVGEVVFTTGMTGYLEGLTDPTCHGHIVMFTYPLIGNIGFNWEDPESTKPQIRGIVAREICETPSNWYSAGSLNDYLTRHGIVGIQGIDTRALTRLLRAKGSINGIITQAPATPEQIERMQHHDPGRPIEKVTCAERFEIPGDGYSIGVLDFGVKASVLSSLRKRRCDLTVYPALTNPQEILDANHDGLILVNGPGDPSVNTQIIANVRQLIGKKPTFGICMGHSIFALANGATTKKLAFGHRGSNHPVKDLAKDRVYITSQNHGYAVDDATLPAGIEVSMRSWNDQTVEGLRYKDFPAFTVQFHPEASPGPRDTAWLFDDFLEMVKHSK